MEVEFRYKDLINRCEQLSSFESEGKFDAAGQSRYLEIHINEVDKIIIRQYIDEAKAILEERLDRMITDTLKVEDKNVYTFDRMMGENSAGYMIWNIKPDSERPDDAVIVFLKSVRIDTEGSYATELTDFYRFVYCQINQSSRYIYLSTPAWYRDMNALFLNSQDGKYYKLQPREGTGYELVETPDDVDLFRWTLRTDTRWKQNASFAKHVSEAIVAYTMSAWLSDKLPERVAFYDALFTASTEMAVKNIFKKQVPRYEE
jgi:hypothetical protein